MPWETSYSVGNATGQRKQSSEHREGSAVEKKVSEQILGLEESWT